MIRKLMASSTVIALMSAGAITLAQAQTDPAKPAITQDTAATDSNAATTTTVADSKQAIAPAHPTLASAIIGRSVYSSSDPQSDNIGDVNDLIVDEKGEVTHAIVGVGGFLGIGEKNVAVPFDQLKVVEENGSLKLVYAATKDQLKAAPAFDRTAYDPAARAPKTTNTATNDTTGMTPMAPAAPAGQTAAPADQTAANAPATDQNTAPAPADNSTAANNATPADNAQPLPADVGFASASPDQVLASNLMDKGVYGPDNKSIGKISDLVLQKEGNTRAALIDVGGVLGVGSKTVAIPFSDLKMSKTDANSTPQVTVAMTADQLKNLPAYDTKALDNTAAANTTPQPTGTAPTGAATDNTMAAAPAPATADQNADQTAAATPDQTTTADQTTTGSINPEPMPQDIAASKLIGAEVYGSDDKDIGAVSDIVFDPKGDINAVVVDVGGFLGIGKKPVALNFNNLNVRTEDNGKIAVSVNATKDQLDKAPAYQVWSK